MGPGRGLEEQFEWDRMWYGSDGRPDEDQQGH